MNKDSQGIIEIDVGNAAGLALFLDFTRAVFPGADFRTWIDLGYREPAYRPHALISGGKIISNVSATAMDLYLNGERKTGVQIGTVGTLPDERGKGLSRRLMEHVIGKYEKNTDFIFLFANETVLDFYPRFGFSREYETLYTWNTKPAGSPREKGLRKAEISDPADRKIIDDLLKTRIPLTRAFGAGDHRLITWWHLINVYRDHVYLSGRSGTVVIFTIENRVLNIIDVITATVPDVNTILHAIEHDQAFDRVCFHFPPDMTGFDHSGKVTDKETYLYVRGDFSPGKEFKFPVTGQT